LNLAVGHKGDWSGRPLPVCCRHGGKRFESTNTSDSSTYFLDGLRLTETGPVGYSVFPRSRQQTGSSLSLHMFVSDTWFPCLFELADYVVQSKNLMSDSRRSNEQNPRYRPCLSSDFEKVDLYQTGLWSTTDFKDGSWKPEVVFLNAFSASDSMFLIVRDCPRRIQFHLLTIWWIVVP